MVKVTTIEMVDNRQIEQLEEEMFSLLRRMQELSQQVRAGREAEKELRKCRAKLAELISEYGGEIA